jgi:hypothetical protein
MFNNFLFENRAVYDIMWKYTVEPGRPHTTKWRMDLHAGHLRLQIHMQNTQYFLQQWLHERTSMLR